MSGCTLQIVPIAAGDGCLMANLGVSQSMKWNKVGQILSSLASVWLSWKPVWISHV